MIERHIDKKIDLGRKRVNLAHKKWLTIMEVVPHFQF